MRIEGILQLPELLFGLLLEAAGDRRLRSRLLKQHEGLHLGRRVEIRSPDRLRLGKHVMIDSGALLHCGGMEWSGGGGGIQLGDHCYVGPHCVLFGAGGIEIGRHSALGPAVVIASHNQTFALPDVPALEQPPRFAPVILEDNVMVNSHATILAGLTIGAGSVIGAGAVVTKSIPPRELWLGVPARKVRDLSRR